MSVVRAIPAGRAVPPEEASATVVWAGLQAACWARAGLSVVERRLTLAERSRVWAAKVAAVLDRREYRPPRKAAHPPLVASAPRRDRRRGAAKDAHCCSDSFSSLWFAGGALRRRRPVPLLDPVLSAVLVSRAVTLLRRSRSHEHCWSSDRGLPAPGWGRRSSGAIHRYRGRR